MSDKLIEFEAGSVLFNEKEGSGCLYIIKEGQVAIFKRAKDGSQLPIALVGSGEFLGEMSLISDNVRSTTARAITPVKAVRMSEKAFKAHLSKSPAWIRALIHGLVTRLYKMDELARKHGVIDERVADAIENVEKKFVKQDEVPPKAEGVEEVAESAEKAAAEEEPGSNDAA